MRCNLWTLSKCSSAGLRNGKRPVAGTVTALNLKIRLRQGVHSLPEKLWIGQAADRRLKRSLTYVMHSTALVLCGWSQASYGYASWHSCNCEPSVRVRAPVSMTYSATPALQMSHFAPSHIGLQSTSGATYSGVPHPDLHDENHERDGSLAREASEFGHMQHCQRAAMSGRMSASRQEHAWTGKQQAFAGRRGMEWACKRRTSMPSLEPGSSRGRSRTA